MKTFVPREPRTTEQLDLEARRARYVKNLIRDALDEDDVIATTALREIAWIFDFKSPDEAQTEV